MLTNFTLHYYRVVERKFSQINMLFDKKTIFWLKICIYLKDTLCRSWWNNFQVRFGTSKFLDVAEITYHSDSIAGSQEVADHELCLLQRMQSGWPHVQSGMYTTDTSVSTWNFMEYWNSSVGLIVLSKPPTQRKTACSFGLLMYSQVL